MHGPLLGEFMGTMVLVLLGDGVVANVLLRKIQGRRLWWIVIATGWGLGVTAGIFTAIACGSSGAHINPAVTLAVALSTHKWTYVFSFWTAQMRGGFAGDVVISSMSGNKTDAHPALAPSHRVWGPAA
jgi:glycerol uptake facilitator protein